MKISVKNIFFALGVSTLMASCGENAWNDNLDGFVAGVGYDSPIEGEFTMSALDYKALADNKTNQAIASEAGLEKALKAVGSNAVFSAEIPAKMYLPAYLASSNAPYFVAPEGSKVNVTYDETGLTQPVIAEIAAAAKYTVSSADYQGAWKSDEDFIEAFAPMTPAAASLPSILKDGITDPADGQYAIVSYKEASDNPVFLHLGGDTPINYEQPFNESIGEFVIYDQTLPEGLSYVWSWGGANYGMKASGYANKTNFDAVSWLVSPEFSLEGKEASFSFEEACNYFTDIETAKKEATVWIRADKGEWKQITGYAFPEKTSWDFIPSGEIDLSSFCGSTIQIAFRYESTAAKAGTWEIKNFILTADNGSVGSNPGFKAAPAKIVANTPVVDNKTAIYQWNGKTWSVASGVLALQAADYAAMGFAANKLEDQDIYLPLYLKQALPYAVAGDQMAVVYNGTACSVLDYNGQDWTVNNDNFQTATAQFQLQNGEWKFVKMVGKAYFNLASELVLDRQYLLVAEGICATPLGASKTYGYLPFEAVKITGDVIEQKNETNAYTFATSFTGDDAIYKAPEGNFFILDSLGRFVIMQGTYNSFNLSNAPKVTDGVIDAGYLWTAEPAGNGAWYIRSVLNSKWIQYSIQYSSFGCYDTEQANAALPSLYVLSE